jgi:hypothetical protein
MRLLVGSPSSFSRQRERKVVRAASSSGNSRPGKRRTSGTGYKLRCESGSKVRIESISSPNRSTRNGTGEPIGNRSISPPRTAYSPGETTWLTCV